MVALALTCLMLAAPPDHAPQAVVICDPHFRTALAPWEKLRKAQGTQLHFLTPAPAATLKAQLVRLAQTEPIDYVVLVGDVDALNPATRERIGPPAFRLPARVNVLFGSEEHIGSDHPYGDFDDDGVPDAAVGRLSVDSAAELKLVVEKILAYEQNRDYGAWRQRVQLVAGVGGFGTLIDGVIENTAKHFLSRSIPAGYDTNMIYGSWQSPYCPDPSRFRDTVLERYRAGSLFWVYLGHGHPERFDRLHVPDAAYPILEKRDIAALQPSGGSPIAVLLACYTGAFDLERDCLAEEMFRAPGGPVALLAGSRVTMPYGMTVLGHELLEEAFVQRTPTLGQLVCRAKQNSVSQLTASSGGAPQLNQPREWIDALAKALSPQPGMLEAERYEHLLLFNLLGDPLLRIAYPETIALDLPEEARGGETVRLQVESPLAGRGTLQLVCRRDQLTFAPPARSTFTNTPAALEELQSTWQRANDHRWSEHPLELPAGRYEIELPVPPHAFGHCQVRIFLHGEAGHALGGGDLYVRRPPTERTARR